MSRLVTNIFVVVMVVAHCGAACGLDLQRLGDRIPIAVDAGWQDGPRAVFHAGLHQYFVIWRTESSQYTHVRGRFIYAAGRMSPSKLLSFGGDEAAYAIVGADSSGKSYLLLLQDLYGNGFYARALDSKATVLDSRHYDGRNAETLIYQPLAHVFLDASGFLRFFSPAGRLLHITPKVPDGSYGSFAMPDGSTGFYYATLAFGVSPPNKMEIQQYSAEGAPQFPRPHVVPLKVGEAVQAVAFHPKVSQFLVLSRQVNAAGIVQLIVRRTDTRGVLMEPIRTLASGIRDANDVALVPIRTGYLLGFYRGNSVMLRLLDLHARPVGAELKLSPEPALAAFYLNLAVDESTGTILATWRSDDRVPFQDPNIYGQFVRIIP